MILINGEFYVLVKMLISFDYIFYKKLFILALFSYFFSVNFENILWKLKYFLYLFTSSTSFHYNSTFNQFHNYYWKNCFCRRLPMHLKIKKSFSRNILVWKYFPPNAVDLLSSTLHRYFISLVDISIWWNSSFIFSYGHHFLPNNNVYMNNILIYDYISSIYWYTKV